MSEEAVEIVSLLQPEPDVDLVELFRGDNEWENLRPLVEGIYEPDVETGFVMAGNRSMNRGVDGLRRTWLDWLEPWDTYRAEIQRYVDCGDRVLVITDDFGRRKGMTAEVRLLGAAVWVVRDGRVARAIFYSNRQDALDDVGLSAGILKDE